MKHGPCIRAEPQVFWGVKWHLTKSPGLNLLILGPQSVTSFWFEVSSQLTADKALVHVLLSDLDQPRELVNWWSSGSKSLCPPIGPNLETTQTEPRQKMGSKQSGLTGHQQNSLPHRSSFCWVHFWLLEGQKAQRNQKACLTWRFSLETHVVLSKDVLPSLPINFHVFGKCIWNTPNMLLLLLSCLVCLWTMNCFPPEMEHVRYHSLDYLPDKWWKQAESTYCTPIFEALLPQTSPVQERATNKDLEDAKLLTACSNCDQAVCLSHPCPVVEEIAAGLGMWENHKLLNSQVAIKNLRLLFGLKVLQEKRRESPVLLKLFALRGFVSFASHSKDLSWAVNRCTLLYRGRNKTLQVGNSPKSDFPQDSPITIKRTWEDRVGELVPIFGREWYLLQQTVHWAVAGIATGSGDWSSALDQMKPVSRNWPKFPKLVSIHPVKVIHWPCLADLEASSYLLISTCAKQLHSWTRQQLQSRWHPVAKIMNPPLVERQSPCSWNLRPTTTCRLQGSPRRAASETS